MPLKLKRQILTIYAALFMVPSFASGVASEAVWVEAQKDIYSIRFARLIDDEWEQFDSPLYTSENAMTSPALGTNSQGRKILIWTEQKKSRSILMSITGEPTATGGLIWSLPSIFSKYGSENFAATIVHDINDEAWVFWSATLDTYSDIVMQRFAGQSWSEPVRVNKTNEVPDDLPRAQITEENRVKVQWNTFDLDSGVSVVRFKEFSIRHNGSPTKRLKAVDNIDEREVSMPTNLPPYTPALLHFPTNAMIQSAPVNFAR